MTTVGITGTRKLSDVGRGHIVSALLGLRPDKDTLVVGGCVGVDAFAGEVAHLMGIKVHVVLPENASQIDPNWEAYATTWEQVDGSYRLRNERLVDRSDGVWAFPNHATQAEDPRSGTWMTIGIAKRSRKLAFVKPQHPPSTSVASPAR